MTSNGKKTPPLFSGSYNTQSGIWSNSSQTMGENSGQRFCLKILVAKEENKVIMAESDTEFMEVLFSFMIMPIATAVRYTRNRLSGDIGCLKNLYASVENLSETFLQDKRFQNVLLNPRSAAEGYCENLKLNLIENGCSDFYVCDDNDCVAISYYNIGKCCCGRDLNYKLIKSLSSRFSPEKEGSFLKSTARFMITDDFKVMSVATIADLNLLNELGKFGKIEERTIYIGRDEVLDLLNHSLRSRTPLSETFLTPSFDKSNNELLDTNHGPRGMNPSLKVKDFWKKKTNIHFKLFFDKVNHTVLYAVVKEDFVDLLFTFLTFPLGYIFNQFPCLSFDGCLGNLHKTIQEIENNLFCCKENKEILINPKFAPGLLYKSNLIGIEEAIMSLECLPSKKLKRSYTSDHGNRKVFEGFIKGPASFLVMDNLDVKPLSPISVKLLVDKLMVPLNDIGEQEVILDEDKAMRLMAASLASKHALTSTFLHRKQNVDCLDFLRLLWGGKEIGLKGY